MYVLLCTLIYLLTFDCSASDHTAWLAFTVQTSTDSSFIYAYQPQTRELRNVGSGNRLLWSPTGRYLVAIQYNDDIAYHIGGRIHSYTMMSLQDNIRHEHHPQLGSNFIWSPDETYLIQQAWLWSSSAGGSASGFDVYNGNGADRLWTSEDWHPINIIGNNGSEQPIGWIDDDHLLVNRRLSDGAPTGVNIMVIATMSTGEWTEIEGESPPHQHIVEEQIVCPEDAIVRASDGRWQTATNGTRLAITNIASDETHEVELPEETARITCLTWKVMQE